MNKKLLLIGVLVYFVSTVGSYFLFANVIGGNIIPAPAPVKTDKDGKLAFGEGLPRTEECPLNGAKYSKQQRQWWEKHRPLGVMVENHVESRPQSGLSSADVIYEAVAEGGITRFLLVFYCQDAEFVGPVRSARTYFLDFISEYGSYPLYAHVGGANTPGPANALGQINDYGWGSYNDMNQFSIGFPTYWRDDTRLGRPVATEHTVYSTTSKLWKYAAEKRDLTEKDKDGDSWDENFVQYDFKDDAPGVSAQTIAFDFWEGYSDYSVKWIYDSKTNSYLRTNGGKPHIDNNNKKQLSAKNIVILYMTERRANDGYENNAHMLYGTVGRGNAVVFQDGKQIQANWSKADRESRTVLTDKSGKNIEFNRGIIWFEVLAVGTDIDVQ